MSTGSVLDGQQIKIAKDTERALDQGATVIDLEESLWWW